MRELTIVLNTMEGNPGEILERTRDYVIRKTEGGSVYGDFRNSSMEDEAVKLTFTGLEPESRFEIAKGSKKQVVSVKKANEAGILELKEIIPLNSNMLISEVKGE